MIINKEKLKIGITELLFLAASTLFAIGIRSWFPVCEAGMEGMVMSCHWAGEVLKASSVVLLVMSVVHIIISDAKIKAGTDISLIAICIMTFFIPGNIISLCKMPEMACRSNTALWNTIFMIVMTLILAADIVLWVSSVRNKHSRNDNEIKVTK